MGLVPIQCPGTTSTAAQWVESSMKSSKTGGSQGRRGGLPLHWAPPLLLMLLQFQHKEENTRNVLEYIQIHIAEHLHIPFFSTIIVHWTQNFDKFSQFCCFYLDRKMIDQVIRGLLGWDYVVRWLKNRALEGSKYGYEPWFSFQTFFKQEKRGKNRSYTWRHVTSQIFTDENGFW